MTTNGPHLQTPCKQQAYRKMNHDYTPERTHTHILYTHTHTHTHTHIHTHTLTQTHTYTQNPLLSDRGSEIEMASALYN